MKKTCVVSVFLVLLLLKFHDLSMGEEISPLKKVARREDNLVLSCAEFPCPEGYICDTASQKCRPGTD
uniref:Kappa-scoloptoxin(04)-Ssd1b n=1 Tax=Scolopendra dehaani TaxID=2609776 RepID=TX41B_SCODE|nr:RecName: Full=Kappa-scoloptoxin(04)-Ssd1b; Short=Kappa-SLPTX(04)-Ssd1b; AltName: Full=Toxin SSD410; Flags: Precursor [Scolopendra dehaani]